MSKPTTYTIRAGGDTLIRIEAVLVGGEEVTRLVVKPDEHSGAVVYLTDAEVSELRDSL